MLTILLTFLIYCNIIVDSKGVGKASMDGPNGDDMNSPFNGPGNFGGSTYDASNNGEILHCGGDSCELYCSSENPCYNIELKSISTSATIDCIGFNACNNITIECKSNFNWETCDLSCTGESSCNLIDFRCDDNVDCTLNADTKSVNNIEYYCEVSDSYLCLINCLDSHDETCQNNVEFTCDTYSDGCCCIGCTQEYRKKNGLTTCVGLYYYQYILYIGLPVLLLLCYLMIGIGYCFWKRKKVNKIESTKDKIEFQMTNDVNVKNIEGLKGTEPTEFPTKENVLTPVPVPSHSQQTPSTMSVTYERTKTPIIYESDVDSKQEYIPKTKGNIPNVSNGTPKASNGRELLHNNSVKLNLQKSVTVKKMDTIDIYDEKIDKNAIIQDLVINWDDIQYDLETDLIGSGHFGNVYHGLITSDDQKQEIAIKTFKDLQHNSKDIWSETVLASNKDLEHENLVKIIGCCQNNNGLINAIIMEYMPSVNLRIFMYRTKQNNILNIDECLIIYIKILSGLTHLHKYNIIHRDIAARNVLISLENGYINANTSIKICDFGSSRHLKDKMGNDIENDTYGALGPIKWMSPEAIRFKKYSKKSDIYMLGMTFYEIFYRIEPYSNKVNTQIIMDLLLNKLERHYPPTKDIPFNYIFNDISPSLKNLIEQCCAFESEKRPTLIKIKQELLSQINKNNNNNIPKVKAQQSIAL